MVLYYFEHLATILHIIKSIREVDLAEPTHECTYCQPRSFLKEQGRNVTNIAYESSLFMIIYCS